MQDKAYDIDLDIRNNYRGYIEVNQGDVATNLFSITLKDEEEIYNLDDTNVSIIFVKSDLTQVLQASKDEVQPILVEDNIIKVRLKPQVTTKPGKVLAEVIVKNIAGKRLVSKIFSFYVSPALFKDELLESNSDFEILTRLIDTVTTLLQEQVLFNIAETERVLNEDDRKREEVKRIALFNKMTTLQSELITLKDDISEMDLYTLNNSLTVLKDDLTTLQADLTNSISSSNAATTGAVRVTNLAINTIEGMTLLAEELIDSEDLRVLAESSRVREEDLRKGNENDRVLAEASRDTIFTEKIDAFETSAAEKINGFIEETERVESLYPLQLTEIKDNLTAHKEDYFQQRQQDNLKVAKVEKELNDYKGIIANVNVNQESRQSVSGVSPISLPSTVGEGSVDFSLKGLTATNLVEGRDIAIDGTVDFDTIDADKYYSNITDTIIIGDGTNKVLTNDKGKVVNILVINLTKTFGAGNEPTVEECDKRFSNYFDGTKSVQMPKRVKSVGRNLFDKDKFSKWKDLDLINTSSGYNGKYVKLKPNTIYRFEATQVGVEIRTWVKMTGIVESDSFAIANGRAQKKLITTNESGLILLEFNRVYTNLDYLLNNYNLQIVEWKTLVPYEPYKESFQYIHPKSELYLRSLPNGVSDEIRVSGGKAELVKRVSDTMEELAEPIITPIQTSGNLISYPSGTVYIENVVADAGIYTTKFNIKELQLPIKSIDKLIKYNFETGVQTVLDTSLAVINEDKKSFTHPNLTDKDMVFIDYYYDVESTLGETTIEYLDSRHTIKDSVNNKFYKWDIKSTNGVPTVNLTEVL